MPPKKKSAPRSSSSHNANLDHFPVLYPILDAHVALAGCDPGCEARWTRLRALVRELAQAGVEILQYRNKMDDDVLVAQDALAMREAAPTLRLILNDRPALVMPAGWDGVHVGQTDLSPSQVRSLLGRRAVVGLSTHTEEQVLAADREPVDYIAIGPVYSTLTKSDTSPLIGIEGVMRARAFTRKPLVAIGGITAGNAPAVYDAGADSVAVISAIFAPGASPAKSVRDFLAIFK
ncbi:MAG: thiamine phosphate synthase [Acidobacteriaceae bacterium]